MDSRQYWELRALQIKANQLMAAKQYEREMSQRMKPLEKEINKLITEFVDKYAKAGHITRDQAVKELTNQFDWTWKTHLKNWEKMATMPEQWKTFMDQEYARSKISRLEALQMQIRELTGEFAENEVGFFEESLKNQYQETYYRSVHMIQSMPGVSGIANFQRFSERQLKAITAQQWKGSNFSARIWKNMVGDLPELLTKTMQRGVVLGYGVDKLSREVMMTNKKFKRSNVHRLIHTELSNISEEATKQAYKDLDVEMYKYLSTLESGRCDKCEDVNDEKFLLNDAEKGVNYPPMHPHCRCTTTPWIPEMDDDFDWESDLDKLLKETDQSFDEWKKEYIPQPNRHNLTVNEERALSKYVGADAFTLNQALRNGWTLTDDDKKWVQKLDNALEKLPKYNGTVYRSMELPEFSNSDEFNAFVKSFSPGKVIDSKAYTSTSPDVYAPDFDIQIIIRNSTKGHVMKGYNNSDENEVLFNRDVKFVSRKQSFTDKQMIVEVEEL